MRNLSRLIASLLALTVLCTGIPCALAAEPVVFTAQDRAASAPGTASADASFYNSLNAVSRAIYTALLDNQETMRDGQSQAVFLFPASVKSSDFTQADYQDAIDALNRDHSEIFWINLSALMLTVSRTKDGRLQGVLEPQESSYYTSAYASKEDVERDIEIMENRLDELVKEVSRFRTVYEKLLFLHDWLVLNNDYNTADSDNQINMRAFEAVSALEGNLTGPSRPVCEGYARAFKLLCDRIGVPCILVSGDGVSRLTRGLHMWNYVYVDDAWYAVDLTWDDAPFRLPEGKVFYTYFLVGSATVCDEDMLFSESHLEVANLYEVSSGLRYPVISETAYEFTAPTGGLDRFTTSSVYRAGLFSDVQPGAWYEPGVTLACDYGLMKGMGDGTFGVSGRVTLAEAITMASRIHALYYNTGASFESEGNWYDGYVDYAFREGFVTERYADYGVPATRAQFARIFAAVLPEWELEEINDVKDGSVSDIPGGASYADAAYLLYRAGVLIGDENGNFRPNDNITRAEVSLIVTRMVDPASRVRL